MKIASFHLSWQKHSSGERCFPVSLKKMPKASKQQNKSCHQIKSSCASSYQKFNMSQNTLYFLKVLVQKLRKILLYFDNGMLLQSAWMKILRIFILSAFMLNISKQAICGKFDFWMYDFYLLDLATRHLELQIHHINIINIIMISLSRSSISSAESSSASSDSDSSDSEYAHMDPEMKAMMRCSIDNDNEIKIREHKRRIEHFVEGVSRPAKTRSWNILTPRIHDFYCFCSCL